MEGRRLPSISTVSGTNLHNVNFQKAYDKIPQRKLIQTLKERGCGKLMLHALQALYRGTKILLKSVITDVSIGVRQGAPTSYWLFVLYMDNLVQKLKSFVSDDDFLQKMHWLLFMDDVVLLVTSREKGMKRMIAFMEFCSECTMAVNKKMVNPWSLGGMKLMGLHCIKRYE